LRGSCLLGIYLLPL